MREHRLQRAFFLGLLALVTGGFLWLIGPFFKPIFWAVVLATLFYPTFQWWERHLGGHAIGASVSTIITIVLIVIVPLFLVGLIVATEASAVYQRLASGQMGLPLTAQEVRNMLPAVADFLERFGVSLKDLQARVSNAALGLSQFLATNLVAFGQNALRGTALFFLSLYLLFFFLRDGAALLERIIGVLPIGDDRERRLFQKFAEVSRATIKGTIVIGLVQGLLGGLIFWALGIEAAALWGVVMAVLSFLPAVGAALVWVPAAALLVATGRVGEGVALLVFGTVIISLADNVLRPLLVGRDTEMPDYVVLVTTLGGLTFFGLSGVVVGPLIGALFLTVWDMFGQEYASIASDGAASDGAASDEAEPGLPERRD